MRGLATVGAAVLLTFAPLPPPLAFMFVLALGLRSDDRRFGLRLSAFTALWPLDGAFTPLIADWRVRSVLN